MIGKQLPTIAFCRKWPAEGWALCTRPKTLAAAAGSHFIASLLFELSPSDPVTLAVSAALLVGRELVADLAVRRTPIQWQRCAASRFAVYF
jgi:hypothetical protein